DVRRPAVHEQEDDALRPRREMPRLRGQRIGRTGGRSITGQNASEAQGAEAAAEAEQQLAAIQSRPGLRIIPPHAITPSRKISRKGAKTPRVLCVFAGGSDQSTNANSLALSSTWAYLSQASAEPVARKSIPRCTSRSLGGRPYANRKARRM